MNKEIKIALVEDDENLRFLVAERLELEGYKVLEAADGDAAEKMILAEMPDIVLLDWMLPGKQGSEVCTAIREQGFDKLVIMMTAKAQRRPARLLRPARLPRPGAPRPGRAGPPSRVPTGPAPGARR